MGLFGLCCGSKANLDDDDVPAPRADASTDTHLPSSITLTVKPDAQQNSHNSIYQPLHKGWIRTLKIMPSSDGVAPIECELVPCALESLPKYIALSYTWGKKNDKRPIFIGGNKVTVKQNLYTAIQQFRQPEHPVLIWIDALCIDQTNILERNSQVPLMGRIYETATEVIAWLGSDDDEALPSTLPPGERGQRMYVFTDTSNTLGSQSTNRGVTHRTTATDFIKEILQELYKATDYNIDEVSSIVIRKYVSDTYFAGWLSVRDIFSRSYWRRAWVMQELTFASRITIRYGTAILPWSDLEAFRDFLVENNSQLLTNDPTRSLSDDTRSLVNTTMQNLRNVITAIQLRNLRAVEGPQYLSRLLRIACFDSLEATDDKDMVFALLNLSNVSGAYNIKTDYAASTALVYMQAMRQIINQPGPGNVFSFLAGKLPFTQNHKDLRLPSWVPDFRPQHQCPSMSVTQRYYDSPHRQGALFTAGKTGSTLLQSIDTPEETSSISVRGILVDSIRSQGPQHWMDISSPPLEIWQQLAGIESRLPYFGTMSRTEAFWRAVFRDQLPLTLSPGAAIDQKRLPPEFFTFFPIPPAAATKEWLGNMVGSSHARWGSPPLFLYPFFVSNKGYIGFAHHEARPGDQICVFYGSEIPHVVRREREGHYKLLGECYVQGIMDGEALELSYRRKYGLQTQGIVFGLR